MMPNSPRSSFRQTAAAMGWRKRSETIKLQQPDQPPSTSLLVVSTSSWNLFEITRQSSFWAQWHSSRTWIPRWPSTPGFSFSLRYVRSWCRPSSIQDILSVCKHPRDTDLLSLILIFPKQFSQKTLYFNRLIRTWIMKVESKYADHQVINIHFMNIHDFIRFGTFSANASATPSPLSWCRSSARGRTFCKRIAIRAP